MSAKKGHIVERIISEAARKGIEKMAIGEKEVYLDSRDINGDDAAAIAEALKGTTVIILFLSENQIGDAGASAIAEAMKVNKTLQELYLGGNQIGDAGASAIAEAMKVNKTLQTLVSSLWNNQIGDTGTLAIARVMKMNDKLQELVLSDNQISDIGVITIAEALVGNTSLTFLDLCRGNKQVTDKSVSALKEMLQHSHITNMEGSSISTTAQEELEALLQIPIEQRTFPIRAVSKMKKRKKYSSFIARHPLDDGISHHVAINIKNALSSSGDVYVDGGRHQHLDISQLLNEMDQSQTVVLLLLNNDTLKMPVCLIELNHAIVNGISIVIVIDENEMNVEDIVAFVDGMETGRGMNEAGRELMKWCGVDIGEVGKNMSKMMMDAARNNTIKRINTNNGDLQDEIEDIAKSILDIGNQS